MRPPPSASASGLALRELPAGGLADDPLALHLALRGPLGGALLESSLRVEAGGEGRGQPLARWSYALVDPWARFAWSPGDETDPFVLAEALVAKRRVGPRSEAERRATGPFAGGAVAAIGYGAAPLFEEKLAPSRFRGEAVTFLFFDRGIAFDHESGIATAFAATDDSSFTSGFRRESARRFLDRAERAAARRPSLPAEPEGPVEPPIRLASDFTRAEYLAAIERVREYIAAGDVYQVNLAQAFRVEWRAGAAPSPGAAYARLRRENPAPFAALVDLAPGRAALSASPELFLERRGRDVTTRPIKGTRPRRVSDAAGDARERRDLLASEKDRAELAMIVDLERNDLGKVCETGSVRVAEPGALETHPFVHHRVATVTGRLRERTTLRELLAATFPTGSITGAPKIRAMEIIAELERSPRGLYTGAIGWIGWDGGDLDLAVAIRTIELDADGGSSARFHAGGGIVTDSDPAAEYEETLHKAHGLLRGLGAEGLPIE